MKKILLTTLTLLSSLLLAAQGTTADYNRAFSLQEKFKDKVSHSNVTPQWIAGTDRFWYINYTSQGKTYMLVDARKKFRIALFDHIKLAETLSKASGKTIEIEKLTLAELRVSQSLDTLRFVNGGTNWVYIQPKDSIINAGKYIPPTSSYWGKFDYEREGEPLISPDKKLSVFTRNNNLFVKDLSTKVEKALSTDGVKDDYYSTNISWSPDSKKVVVMQIHAAEIRQLTLIESSPNDQLQPKIQTRDYQKPGDVLPQKTPIVFDIATGQAKIPANTLFDKQFDLPNWFSWSADNKTVFFEYNQRGHQLYRVLGMSTETGEVRTVIEETSSTFVNYTRYFKRDLPKTKEIIWGSERDNWNHLYVYDAQTGKVKNQITKGTWYVREVVNVDEKKREIIFSANGMVTNEDPYLIRYYRIKFDGSGLTCLTPDEGMHQVWFSEDKKYLVDVYSMTNKAPVAVLRSTTDGKLILSLEKADISELVKAGWSAPETFVAKGRDGKTDIWGIIQRPTNFDPSKKYPVIEYIYSGPGSQYVPKTFIPFNRNMSAIAELGFIVIQMDGMGTSYRSKNFEEVIYKNLKDAGFADRIAWTKAAATKYPYMDIDRVGIFGASAGGQEAMGAVLFHPEHYKAAYSSCGCHDNRMDKIWWNEQWMGYPIDKSYEESSNTVNAHLLTRPLMLVVGEMDDNVDPASTYQVCNALIKANKDFELVVLPGTGHTMGGDYGEHKRYDFFVKNLIGVNPPFWNKVDVKK